MQDRMLLMVVSVVRWWAGGPCPLFSSFFSMDSWTCWLFSLVVDCFQSWESGMMNLSQIQMLVGNLKPNFHCGYPIHMWRGDSFLVPLNLLRRKWKHPWLGLAFGLWMFLVLNYFMCDYLYVFVFFSHNYIYIYTNINIHTYTHTYIYIHVAVVKHVVIKHSLFGDRIASFLSPFSRGPGLKSIIL